MTSRALRRVGLVAGIATTSAIVLVGCAGGTDGTTGDGGQITLTVTTFGTFGYDDLYAEYEELNPNINIEATNIDTGGNARTDAFTKIGAGSGLSDVVAIEEGWLGAIMEEGVAETFVDLRDYGIEDRKADWIDWKYDQVTDPDGRVLGYGTDIGPSGICYSTKAFEAAGLPTDRDEVATLLEGDWQHYFDIGRQYNAATGKAWYDHSGFVWNSMVNQLPEGYYTPDGELNVEGNAELKERFELLGAATEDGLSAASTAWNWNDGKDFLDNTFATLVCPGWMLGVAKGQIEAGGGDETNGWDFAPVFPGGPVNWGGAWLSVPETSSNKEEAAKLASWLTEPEQQVKQSAAAGNFPSTREAQETLAAEATPNEFFNGAPTGAILAARAEGVKAQFKGPQDSVIQENVFGPALTALDNKETDTAGAWTQALGLLDSVLD
ncbi:ABC transporter substrate-binding protein [Microbacterium radiodurans]|uniref:Extracellular solute-binding protein n=1 Tax=Microbacterium radiodurans TaxID=661398 RepID=A0A5J5IX24_9MICO|nr:extracellular solute-binding protein [Microbacterium radiodurans]KAA9089365.1 extracellular solute-binding protein [Microbacterium radiodurans]